MLSTEDPLQPQDRLQLGTEDRLQRALALAYRYLNPRDRTEAEMRRHLDAKGVQAADGDQAIGTLLAQGYLDDARFARLFTQDKRELEQWGSDRIRRILRARGIEFELIERAINGAPPDAERGSPDAELDPAGPDGWPDAERARAATDGSLDAERARALGLLRRRYPTPPGDHRQRNRALGLLIRKGYDGQLALDVLAAYARDG